MDFSPLFFRIMISEGCGHNLGYCVIRFPLEFASLCHQLLGGGTPGGGAQSCWDGRGGHTLVNLCSWERLILCILCCTVWLIL